MAQTKVDGKKVTLTFNLLARPIQSSTGKTHLVARENVEFIVTFGGKDYVAKATLNPYIKGYK